MPGAPVLDALTTISAILGNNRRSDDHRVSAHFEGRVRCKIVMKNHRAFKRLFPDTGIDWYVIHSLGKQ